MYTVLLYYKYIRVQSPAAERDFQLKLCQRLGLKGRIIVADEGINGTVAGTKSATDAYIEAMGRHDLFCDIEYKVEEYDTVPFPRLRVKVRDEIVTLGVEVETTLAAPKVSAEELHELLQDPNVVMFDARNNYESAIGRFKGAITPDIGLFKDLPDALNNYDDLKDKTVVTYCTGGIRCEKASALMRERGFRNVYQLDGGIIKYAQAFPDGEFEGEVFVFDGRMSVGYGEPTLLSQCNSCESLTAHYQNCANPMCHALMLVCETCRKHTRVCSEQCSEVAIAE